MLRRVLATGTVLAFVGLASASAFAQGGADTIKRASDAMGATQLKTLRYVAEGTGWTFGQAFRPGMAWPKITVHGQTRTINYDTGSMREEFVLSRAEPKGGGGYPLEGQQRNDQFVGGGYAWNLAGTNPVAAPRAIADRTHQLWITPHGALKAAARNNATARAQGKVATLSFSEPGRFTARVFLDSNSLVERVESRAPDPVLGDIAVVTTYSGYRDFGGVKFPTRIRQSMAGFPTLDVAVKEVQPNAPADIALPDAVRTATERVVAEKVADGVWFVGGGSHNSVVIEMKDHIVLVEAPLNDGRTVPVIAEAKRLAPGKPIRYVVNSHQHFDHSGGLRTAVAEGATIVTQSGNKAFFERAFANPNRIAPDRLAASGRKPKFLTVDSRRTLTDGARSLEVLRIVDSAHNDTFLMVWLPKERILIEADAYTPLPPNAPPPAKPNAYNVNLIDNLARLQLPVATILPLHGRVVPAQELYTTAGAKMPN